MHRALLLGQNAGSGLSLHGRTLRISEASGPGNALDTNGRERSRSRSGELSIATAYNPYQQQPQQQQPQHHDLSPSNNYPEFLSPTFPVPYGASPISPGAQYAMQPQTPALRTPSGNYGGGGGNQSTAAPHTTDPNNTTVFVGGLPACISEETLKVSYIFRRMIFSLIVFQF